MDPDNDAAMIAMNDLKRAVLRWVMSEMDDPHSSYDAELEYCHDMIVDAAKRLAAATG
jgi:hypothetical protein